MANINRFIASLTGGGARPNLFRVDLTFPSFISGADALAEKARFTCRSASLPGSQIQNTEVSYLGRHVNFAGERQFQPFNVSIYNDTTFDLRNAFEAWQSRIIGYDNVIGTDDPGTYQVDLFITQLGRKAQGGELEELKKYKMVDAYPTSITEIQLDWDQGSQIEMFDVEFTYNYFEPI